MQRDTSPRWTRCVPYRSVFAKLVILVNDVLLYLRVYGLIIVLPWCPTLLAPPTLGLDNIELVSLKWNSGIYIVVPVPESLGWGATEQLPSRHRLSESKCSCRTLFGFHPRRGSLLTGPAIVVPWCPTLLLTPPPLLVFWIPLATSSFEKIIHAICCKDTLRIKPAPWFDYITHQKRSHHHHHRLRDSTIATKLQRKK